MLLPITLYKQELERSEFLLLFHSIPPNQPLVQTTTTTSTTTRNFDVGLEKKYVFLHFLHIYLNFLFEDKCVAALLEKYLVN